MKAGQVLRLVGRGFKEDRLGDVAAMMTYYAVFSLFPMALFVIMLALLVLPAEAIRQGVDMAARAMPADVARMLHEHVGRMEAAAQGGFAVGAAAVALWSASRGAVSLGRALNNVYNREDRRPWWKIQLSGILVTLGVALLLLIALALLVLGPSVGSWLDERFGLGTLFSIAWTLGRWVGAGLLVMIVWAIMYRFLPDTDQPLRVFTPGAFIGVLLWVGASLALSQAVGRFLNYEKTFGALAAVIVFLLWLWISNMALLMGAEINDAIHRSKEAGAAGTPRAS